ncbi:LysR family transcriptional regulator [Paenibacillus chondroitinus]|uniref:LysR family transcriptional regulator n=1 Tax=Paenibacillus chondroitinus TaxID=59842 RepID=A0ABU6DMM9_9BACL|nr:LysR family transcriptional regulator [Paenibacillus chondroitinus]MCY9662432.1 LysR family transcriptional regulator [Paenibacillus anseongense]MEB4798575.1 LysR family transcriptional regulator [Paenibacillus chondroitinus]
MELTYLKTFREVAKWGSYTRAAEVLGYAQSSITTQIQKLEEAYGAVLVERFGRSMKLTLAGEALLQYANDIYRLHEESKEVVSRQSKGILSIGTIETLAAFFLPPHLQAYRQHFPEINVMIQPGNEPFIIEAVKEGALDVGIILDPPFSDPELYCHILREEELVIIASPAHKFAAGIEGVQIGDLEKESLILTEEGCTYRAMLLRTLKSNQVPYSLSYEFGNLEAIKQCVMYGLGIALLPRIVVAEDIQNGRLAAVPLVHPDFKFYTQLIYSKKKWRSKAFTGFLDVLGASNYQNE